MVEENDLLARQLRAYGDALEAAHTDRAEALGPTADPFGSQRDVRWVLVAAAVLFVVSGSVAWLLRDSDGAVVETDVTDDSVTTTVPLEEAPQDVRLLPASAGWEMVQAESLVGDGFEVGGVWAWEADGSLVTLVSPFGGEVAGSLADARPAVEHNRVTVGWQTLSSETVGLQAISLDADRLLQLAAQLRQSEDGEWVLPGHDLIAERAAGSRSARLQHQALFSAQSSDPALRLRGEIDLTYSVGPEADLYAELFETSGLGSVEPLEMLDEDGYIVRSDAFGSFALAHVDGVNVRVSTVRGGSGLEFDGTAVDDFVRSLEVVDAERWGEQVGLIDLVVDRAGAEMLREQEALAEAQAEAQLDDLEDLAAAVRIELPRYVLPDPWELDIVTDRGLWTEEQRLQSEAMNAANNANPGPTGTIVMSQGFAPVGVVQAGLVIPEIVVRVVDYGPGLAPAYELNGQRGFSIDGFEGSSMTNGPGGTPFSAVDFADDQFSVSVMSARVGEEELREFASSLQLVGADASEGFESSDSSFVMAARLANHDPWGLTDNSWFSAYEGPDVEVSGPRVTVEQQTDAEFVMRLARPAGFFGTEIELLSPGVYLLTPDVEELNARGVESRQFATVIEREPDAGYTTSVLVQGGSEQAIALFEQLEEVDIDTWAELAGPINSDPLRPR